MVKILYMKEDKKYNSTVKKVDSIKLKYLVSIFVKTIKYKKSV